MFVVTYPLYSLVRVKNLVSEESIRIFYAYVKCVFEYNLHILVWANILCNFDTLLEDITQFWTFEDVLIEKIETVYVVPFLIGVLSEYNLLEVHVVNDIL